MYHGKNGKTITPKKQTQDDVSPYNLPRRWSKGNFNHFFREPKFEDHENQIMGQDRNHETCIIHWEVSVHLLWNPGINNSLVGGFNPVEKY